MYFFDRVRARLGMKMDCTISWRTGRPMCLSLVVESSLGLTGLCLCPVVDAARSYRQPAAPQVIQASHGLERPERAFVQSQLFQALRAVLPAGGRDCHREVYGGYDLVPYHVRSGTSA